MRAIEYTRYGPPDVLRLSDVPRPVPGVEEVLIKVHATTVNQTDCGFLRARPAIVRLVHGLSKPKHTILGTEFAGEIAGVGRDVAFFAKGDRVFGYCEGVFGAHAEYMTLPASGSITTLPAGLSYEEAAPATEGAHYALGYLRAADIGAETRILVYGATGAIGSATVQLAKHYYGAHVTAVCGTAHLELVRSLGADEVIDYQTRDFTRTDETYDCVFDAVGKSSFGRCRSLLRPGGTYASTEPGFMWQNPVLALWTAAFGDRSVLFPIPTHSKEDIVFLKELIEQGRFRPLIDRCYPLEQVPDAYRFVETGQKVGSVVINVTRDAQDEGTV